MHACARTRTKQGETDRSRNISASKRPMDVSNSAIGLPMGAALAGLAAASLGADVDFAGCCAAGSPAELLLEKEHPMLAAVVEGPLVSATAPKTLDASERGPPP